MKTPFLLLTYILVISLCTSCENKPKPKIEALVQNNTLKQEKVLELMQKHLDAVSNRDLKSLETTLSPQGNMQLILPGTEIIEKTTGFIEYHREWFKSDNWSIASKILNTEVGKDMAMVIVESVYKEPERDGKPYFNRMTISYDLKKINGKWYVIKDHMASVQKSTDLE